MQDGDSVKALEIKLSAALKQIEELQRGQSTPVGSKGTPSSSITTPSPSHPAGQKAAPKVSTQPKAAAAKAKATAKAAAVPPAAEDEDDDDEEGNQTALQRYKMVDARLRRLCERKGSGKLKVPQAIHDQWVAGGKQRDELRMLLEQYEFDKDL
eukprot:s2483_g5.t1